MDTRKRSFLAALVLANNGLFLMVPPSADACIGGTCPPLRGCLEERCAFLSEPDLVLTCSYISAVYGAGEWCHPFRVSCTDSPIDTEQQCDVLDSVVHCQYVQCNPACN